MRLPYVVLIAAMAVPFVSVEQTSDSRSQPNNQEQLTNSDKLFLTALIQEDISEIELAHMALTKSSDPQVQQYAQSKILGADPEMRDGAAQIAQQYGMQAPSAPNARQQKIHDELSTKSGKVFDSAYMNYEASQQAADVKLVDAELQSTSNQAMKNYLGKEKPPVVEAAQSAQTISTGISSGMTHYRQKAAETGSDQH
jgi:predicted outer membrane protein